jgi:hypothetical protein
MAPLRYYGDSVRLFILRNTSSSLENCLHYFTQVRFYYNVHLFIFQLTDCGIYVNTQNYRLWTVSYSANVRPTSVILAVVRYLVISLLMPPLLGHRSSLWLHIRRTGHNPPRGPIAGCWVLTTANASGTNGLTCVPKHGGSRDNTFFVTHYKSAISTLEKCQKRVRATGVWKPSHFITRSLIRYLTRNCYGTYSWFDECGSSRRRRLVWPAATAIHKHWPATRVQRVYAKYYFLATLFKQGR